MSFPEKAFSVFGIIFAVGLMIVFTAVPESRQIGILLPLSFLGLLINIGLMFIVFKDIFTRWQFDRSKKIFWTALLLLFWPAIIIYLPVHGFRSRA